MFPSDPPENCHLTVKTLPKIFIFFKWQFSGGSGGNIVTYKISIPLLSVKLDLCTDDPSDAVDLKFWSLRHDHALVVGSFDEEIVDHTVFPPIVIIGLSVVDQHAFVLRLERKMEEIADSQVEISQFSLELLQLTKK